MVERGQDAGVVRQCCENHTKMKYLVGRAEMVKRSRR